MNTEIVLTTNPATQTTGQVANTGLTVARDGIKDVAVLGQLESIMSANDTQTIISADSSNSAVTLRVPRDGLDNLRKTLQNMAISGNQIMQACIDQLTEALEASPDAGLIELNRGNVSSLANTAHELEELETQNSRTSALARIAYLPAAGPEWVSHANTLNIENIVNTINADSVSDIGTELLNSAVESVPTDIGLAPSGTTIREGAISLDSQSAVRPVMQNAGQDAVSEQHLNSADAFSSSDIAVTPLADMNTLVNLAKHEAMVQNNPYPMPKLLVTTAVVEGVDVVTGVAYETLAALTDDELNSLDLTKSLLDQDWAVAEFDNASHDNIVTIYNCETYEDIDQEVLAADRLLECLPSGRTVSGIQAYSILSGVKKLWNTFKNHTGASHASIAGLIGVGAQIAAPYIKGSTGTTVGQIGKFIEQGAAAFIDGEMKPALVAKRMILNYVPNLTRLAQADSNQNVVSSTRTATAVAKFGNDFISDETSIPTAVAARGSSYPKVKILKSRFSK
jgi:hypothetical protein